MSIYLKRRHANEYGSANSHLYYSCWTGPQLNGIVMWKSFSAQGVHDPRWKHRCLQDLACFRIFVLVGISFLPQCATTMQCVQFPVADSGKLASNRILHEPLTLIITSRFLGVCYQLAKIGDYDIALSKSCTELLNLNELNTELYLKLLRSPDCVSASSVLRKRR
jgi:hypothetical protein